MYDNITIQDSGPLGCKYTVMFCGKFLGEFVEWDDITAAIKQKCEDEQYWPDIYYTNDHGNVNLIDCEGNILEEEEEYDQHN